MRVIWKSYKWVKSSVRSHIICLELKLSKFTDISNKIRSKETFLPFSEEEEKESSINNSSE